MQSSLWLDYVRNIFVSNNFVEGCHRFLMLLTDLASLLEDILIFFESSSPSKTLILIYRIQQKLSFLRSKDFFAFPNISKLIISIFA